AKGPGACILKDDGVWLADKFLESDGYILGAPVWSLSPTGIVDCFPGSDFRPQNGSGRLGDERDSGLGQWS
ncbi:MAG: hypothetical protein ACOX1A_04595, partial [Saccharofermentanales bacterium]